jgi:hypothetical protein
MWASSIRQNAFLYRAIVLRLPDIHIGSSHSLGPWSVMQAALQGGAATSRLTISFARGRARVSPVCAWAVTDMASDSASGSAARKYFVFIVWLMFAASRPSNWILGNQVRV